jgi:molybdate/tungstate transport system permease protein
MSLTDSRTLSFKASEKRTGFGRFTTVGGIAAAAGVPLTDSLIGVVFAQTFVTSRAGFASVDEDLEHASRTMGHGPIATFWNVSLPSARTAVAAGVVLTFARAVGEFSATMMVAYNPRTMPTLICVDFIARGIDGVVAPALVLIGVSVTVIVAVQKIETIPALRK